MGAVNDCLITNLITCNHIYLLCLPEVSTKMKPQTNDKKKNEGDKSYQCLFWKCLIFTESGKKGLQSIQLITINTNIRCIEAYFYLSLHLFMFYVFFHFPFVVFCLEPWSKIQIHFLWSSRHCRETMLGHLLGNGIFLIAAT